MARGNRMFMSQFNALGIANATSNIAFDRAVIGLPLHKIAGLSCNSRQHPPTQSRDHLRNKHKRYMYIPPSPTAKFILTNIYPADGTVPTSYWSIIERFSGIVCINLPSTRRLYRKVTHLCFGTPQTGQEEGYQNVTPGYSSASKKRKLPMELLILKTAETAVRRE
ncbi:hypothetical protein ANOM_002150 [Aspergillus nomiae NRRL 13137]|uniref:Uncharacterized protein n=1 Tax=Aspergillus nomiae NRRL (strain ATCC 15546 / NRRL 13137 / CBS 260.88 / M93) TaxID=1509407 RepID=A0A0L1JBX9_ASPN3|nr:uncharacterized protein ANOM_002150 [Aspergillus nomiae NRRL 13137]KNG89232.1 hypothetical protein ANOM_002150 [Aspergillus nomiae NRRL 13137]